MKDKQADAQSDNTWKGDIPLHLRMMDLVLEQIDSSAPLVTMVLKDLQKIYLKSMRTAFRFGDALEKRSGLALNLFHGAEQLFESVAPVAMRVQLDITDAMVTSTRNSVRALRKNFTERKDKGSDG